MNEKENAGPASELADNNTTDSSGTERLQKILSRAGYASRRAAEKLIAEGQVRVNGQVVTELGAKAHPARDKITVNGKPIVISDAATTVVLLHKPRNTVCTKSDPQGRATVLDLLPKKLQKLNPVGRLDYDTTGLLLLTDDGDLLHKLTHPSHGVEKTYHARAGGKITPEVVKILQEGVYIPEEGSKKRVKTAPCRVTIKAQTETNALVEITLREGRNRQVRKMLEVMGHRVSSLRRVKFAGLELDELTPGAYRILLPGEVHALRKAAEKGFKIKASRAAKVPAVRPSKAKPKPEEEKKGARPSARKSREEDGPPAKPYGAKSRAGKPSSGKPATGKPSSRKPGPLGERIRREWK